MTTAKGKRITANPKLESLSRELLIEEWVDALTMWAGNDEQVRQDMEGFLLPVPRGDTQSERIRLWDIDHADLRNMQAVIELRMHWLETAFEAIQTLPGWDR